MNPLAIKGIAALVLIAALGAGLTALHHHIFEQGVTQEKDRRDKIDAANTIKEQTELAAINERLRATKADLDKALAELSTIKTELEHEKADSTVYQARLAAGTERLRILTVQRRADPAGSAPGSPAGPVDPGSGTVEDIAPTVASDLERIRETRDEAIDRLGACIKSYDAVKTAADKP